jgi:glutathione S-transferase
MKLIHTPTSPFVRKVMVVAHETGLVSRIETTFLRPSPLATEPTISRANPLAKVPVLTTDDGETLFDSPVICEYLDTLNAGAKLVPTAGPERWRVLRQQALADGILDSAILVFYELTLRPKELHWTAWLDGQMQKVAQALDALEASPPRTNEPVDLGQIATACMLGWLEFRSVVPKLREGRPALFAWYDAFRARPSMKATEPHT